MRRPSNSKRHGSRNASARVCWWLRMAECKRDGTSGAGRTVDYRQTAVTARVAVHRSARSRRLRAIHPGGSARAAAGRRRSRAGMDNDAGACRTTVRRAGARTSWASCSRRSATGSGGSPPWSGGGRFRWRCALRRRAAAPRTVRIGNAAQTLHPVAGQGLNLGLRDAWELAAELRRCTARAHRRAASSSRATRRGGASTGAAGSGLPTAWRGFSPAIYAPLRVRARAGPGGARRAAAGAGLSRAADELRRARLVAVVSGSGGVDS